MKDERQRSDPRDRQNITPTTQREREWQRAVDAAHAAADRGDSEIAERSINAAVAEAERLAADVDPADALHSTDHLALTWRIAGDVAVRLGDHEHAIACYQRAESLLGADAPGEPDRARRRAMVQRSLAESFVATGREEDARRWHLASVGEFARIHRDHPDHRTLTDRLAAAARTGWFLASIDASSDLATVARHAFDDLESHLGTSPPPLDAESAIADLHVQLSRADPTQEPVEDRLQEAHRLRVAMHQRLGDSESRVGVAKAHRELGRFLTSVGRSIEAASHFERGLEWVTDPITGEPIDGESLRAGRMAIAAAHAWDEAGRDHRRLAMLDRGIPLLVTAFAEHDESSTLNEAFLATSHLVRAHLRTQSVESVTSIADHFASVAERALDRRPEDPIRLKIAGFAALLRGQIAESVHRIEDATRHYERYVACFDTLGTDMDPELWGHDLAMALSSASTMAARFADDAASERLHRDAARCMSAVVARDPSGDHLDTLASIHEGAATLARERGRYRRARVLERRQIAARMEACRRHPDDAASPALLCRDLRTLARAAESEGRRADATRLLRQLLEHSAEGIGRHPDDLGIRWSHAIASVELGSRAESDPDGDDPRPHFVAYLEDLRWLHRRVGTASSATDVLIGLGRFTQFESDSRDVDITTEVCREAAEIVAGLSDDARHQFDPGIFVDLLTRQSAALLDRDDDETADAILQRAEFLARDSIRRGEAAGRHARLSRILALRSRLAAKQSDWHAALRWKREEVAIDLEHLSCDTAWSTVVSAIELAEAAGAETDAGIWRHLLESRFDGPRDG